MKEAFRILLTFAASLDWTISTIDIKSAFLQGEQPSRPIDQYPPKEVDTTKIWKLKKNVYGLADASLKWYQNVRNTFELAE